MKYKKRVQIMEVKALSDGIYSIWIKDSDIVREARAGQFLSIYSDDRSLLLPRPISICMLDKEKGLLRMVFRVAGKGTLELSLKKPGDEIDVVGPLGNGYPVDDGIAKEDAILIGGGIGVPPILELARELNCQKEIVVGYRNSDTFLLEELEQNGTVHIATEDGSIGTKGNVIDAIRTQNVTGKVIYACGPKPMLLGVREYARANGLKAYISLEERMACGIGACLACVCETKDVDDHSNVHNTRICKDGPVFDAEVVWP